ncbi:hypothetical protein AAG570_006173 [Ranatra chinensis]|uniref:Uncharacterized protein n=1 Tax=Ranatra chinensis TaxID=642074 RepID=A0ABD0XX90_9HEMI
MASKRQNMFYDNKKQEMCDLPSFCDCLEWSTTPGQSPRDDPLPPPSRPLGSSLDIPWLFSNDMNYDPDSTAEDSDYQKPVRINDLRARGDGLRLSVVSQGQFPGRPIAAHHGANCNACSISTESDAVIADGRGCNCNWTLELQPPDKSLHPGGFYRIRLHRAKEGDVEDLSSLSITVDGLMDGGNVEVCATGFSARAAKCLEHLMILQKKHPKCIFLTK